MDQHHLELIRDTIKQGFENTNEKIDNMSVSLTKHVEKDEIYWKKIDDQEAQVRMAKWLGSGALGSIIVKWVYDWFGHR